MPLSAALRLSGRAMHLGQRAITNHRAHQAQMCEPTSTQWPLGCNITQRWDLLFGDPMGQICKRRLNLNGS